MRIDDDLIIFLATGFHVGKFPLAPGTFGSLVGLPFCFVLAFFDTSFALLLILLFIAFSIYVAHRAIRILGEGDPGCVVIDEMAGIIVTLAGIPLGFGWICAGFILFRILDIAKPFPIRWLDQRISGGAGVVLDDVAAGIAANLILRLGVVLS